jgi:hypothetical protein
VEKYRNPLVADRESVPPVTKTSKIFLLIFVVNDHQKGNRQQFTAEI